MNHKFACAPGACTSAAANAALVAASWHAQRGYPLADAVEFMDRAKSWVYGEALGDAGAQVGHRDQSSSVPAAD